MTTQTQHESSSPPPPPLSPPTLLKSSLTPSQRNTSSNSKDTGILDKGKGNLYIMMHSNRKFINFKELIAGEYATPVAIPCGNIRKAESILNSTQISTPLLILFQTGINNLDDH